MQLILGQVITGLSMGMVYFLIAVGLSLAFGTLKVFNVAHASFFMFGAYLSYWITTWLSPNGFLYSVMLAPIIVAGLGGLIEIFLLRPIYTRDTLYQLILTFGLILVIGDVCKLIWGGDIHIIDMPKLFQGRVILLGTTLSYYQMFMILIGPAILSLILIMFNKTKLGRIVRAVTYSRDMSSALGINVSLIYTVVFMFASWLAGLAGAVMAPYSSVFLGMDATVMIECFIIVVIGGLGSVGGAFVGAIVFGLANSLGILILPKLTIAISFIVMAAVLIFRPWGLMGKPE